MDKRLRLMLVATTLLLITQIGQFVAIRDLNTSGHESPLAVLFSLVGIFFVPTSFILTGVIAYSVMNSWRSHQRLLILALVNLLIIASVTWFFADQCSWSAIFGVSLRTCRT
jgi:hypothetical protein